MSPANFDHQPRIINGPRPSPLKIKKESHVIQKSSSSSSIPTGSAVVNGGVTKQQQQRNHPIIIYTYSPKVIHTQPRDFMALVQKLTGLSRPKEDETKQEDQKVIPRLQRGNDYNAKNTKGDDDNDSCSDLTKENYGRGNQDGNNKYGVHVGDISPINLNPSANPYLADIPLFTPNSTNFFCSPKPVYRYTDSGFASPTVDNLIYPSVLEFIKELPEY